MAACAARVCHVHRQPAEGWCDVNLQRHQPGSLAWWRIVLLLLLLLLLLL
jgi:hypothetical protein